MKRKNFLWLLGILLVVGLVSSLLVKFLPQLTNNYPKVEASHVVDSSPSHQEVFATTPINIVVTTDLNIKSGNITLLKGWQTIPLTVSLVDTNKLTLRAPINQKLEDGTYLVKYSLDYEKLEDLTSDKREKLNGQFSFTIDSSLKVAYKDLRNQKAVTINMKELSFDQPKIIISPGTQVTWVNQEADIHFVNTDPHPSHTYHLLQNSLEIKSGETYLYSFSQPGEYPYHCSAHYPEGMIGRIIVE